MADVEIPDEDAAPDDAEVEADAPLIESAAIAAIDAYRAALRGYDGATLSSLLQSFGAAEPPPLGRAALAARIAEYLGEPRIAARILATYPHPIRVALGLMTITETHAWPIRALRHALAVLGLDAAQLVPPLVARGLVVVAAREGETLRDPSAFLDSPRGETATIHAHPAALAAARTVLPEEEGPTPCEAVVKPREADGLEPIIRLSALWQRVADAPLRQTQQGTLYKRDRDRLEDDPVLAGPIADALEPLPDMPSLWLVLARGVGLIESEEGSERIGAAEPSFWSDNAIHLPRSVALRWLGLKQWHEQGGMQREGATTELALPFVRGAVMLWLAKLGENEWVAVEDLAAFLRARSPQWSAASFLELPAPDGVTPEPEPARKPKKGRPKEANTVSPEEADALVVGALLLGAGYQFGLIRVAEEAGTGRKAVQLTALGRYVLALGPPPPARAVYEHFLFVQPSFEIIAYRQGLSPSLVGQFGRFTLWSQVGAALATRLTPESVYRGLEGGLTPEGMLDLLGRHSPRALPAGVAEAVRTWSGRRDRITYHAAATLVEFATPADAAAALAEWPAGVGPPPLPISERLILVENDATIPWSRFRMTGSRNYRTPPEACVEVGDDGVSLTLDMARSDLLVDAEIARFADEVAPESSSGTSGPKRRFVVSAASLARAEESGLTPQSLAQWYERRTGNESPPALRLLQLSSGPKPPALTTVRILVVRTPSADLLDGLLQFTETRDYLGERLGPTSVAVFEASLPLFRSALERLGLSLEDGGSESSNPAVTPKALTPRFKPR
jgi:hypothetical protein